MHLCMDRTYHEAFYIMELKLLIKDLEKGKNNTRKQKNKNLQHQDFELGFFHLVRYVQLFDTKTI